jgi:chromosome partitioning protein
MSVERPARVRPAQVILVGNEKGGSGKSTVAMHIAISLIKSGQRVATIDLDSRQKTFTNYIENRRAWAEHIGRDLGVPDHICFDSDADADNRQARFTDTVDALASSPGFVVIDAPGHDSQLVQSAHSLADTLVTPLNDSFVDFDVLANVDPETFNITGISHYALMVQEARAQREHLDNANMDWIVLRNRLSMLSSRNKRLVGDALEQLSRRLNFRYVEGLAERMIFREFYPRGITAVDDLDQKTLGTRPTMSHATARLELENLLGAMGLRGPTESESGEAVGERLDAA